MSSPEVLPVLVMGGVKHLYIVQGLAAHPRFELVAVTDEEDAPDWVHERNEAAAAALRPPVRARRVRGHRPLPATGSLCQPGGRAPRNPEREGRRGRAAHRPGQAHGADPGGV